MRIQVSNAEFNAIMLNKKRFAHLRGEVQVGDVIVFERVDGSSSVQRQVCHIGEVKGSPVCSIAPVGAK